MIETLIHRLNRNLLPAISVVARLATLWKAAMMWILVAVRALIEWDTRVLRFAIGAVRVAFGALHLGVQSS